MKPWQDRPPEVAHLFNPAFCALLLRESVVGYMEGKPEGMPYAIAFLLLPIVLHKSTRSALPNTTATRMHPWLQDHQEARVGFPERCAAVGAYTREGILFAARNSLLAFSQQGLLTAPRLRIRGLAWPQDSESAICRQRARFVGRWLANAGDSQTIFVIWGVRP